MLLWNAGRFLIEAHLREGRTIAELAAAHGVHRSWLYKLLARYRAEGEAGLAPRPRRPGPSPLAMRRATEYEIVRLRRRLLRAGLDGGALTLHWHLVRRHGTAPSVSSIWRLLRRRGLVTPEPHKRPRSSLHRFEAALPNELWQIDATHWQLAGGAEVEILNVIDDHSRVLVRSDCFRTVKAADVVASFHAAAAGWGYPAALLSDNGAVFSGASRGGKVLLESELERLGIRGVHSRPHHPQTCGKVERFHQTLKRYLANKSRRRRSVRSRLSSTASGTLVVSRLRAAGCNVRVLSRRSREHREGIEFVTGDLATGDGIAAAVKGSEIILHCAGTAKGDDVNTRNLVNAAAPAGAKHLVYISVVGADRTPVVSRADRAMFGYFASKRLRNSSWPNPGCRGRRCAQPSSTTLSG